MQAALRLAPALLAPMWRHVAALTSPSTLPTIYRAGSESGNTRLRLLALAFTVQHVTQLHDFLVTLPRGDVELVLGHDWLEVWPPGPMAACQQGIYEVSILLSHQHECL